MFKNYLKIALRNILRYRTYSFINIIGLAIGMACCILILLFVQDELGYDGYHANADHIYRTSIEFVVFILSAMLALVIALVTVSYQAIKAALANPVETLRYE